MKDYQEELYYSFIIRVPITFICPVRTPNHMLVFWAISSANQKALKVLPFAEGSFPLTISTMRSKSGLDGNKTSAIIIMATANMMVAQKE